MIVKKDQLVRGFVFRLYRPNGPIVFVDDVYGDQINIKYVDKIVDGNPKFKYGSVVVFGVKTLSDEQIDIGEKAFPYET